MVGSSYMTEVRRQPSALKRQIDQELIPAAINGVACLEAGVARLAQGVRDHKLLALGIAIGIGALLGGLRRR